MEQMTLTRFRKNGGVVAAVVRAGKIVKVSARLVPLLRVRQYEDYNDSGIARLPWSITSQRSAADWRDFFTVRKAEVATLDGAPSFVVERWSDDEQSPE